MIYEEVGFAKILVASMADLIRAIELNRESIMTKYFLLVLLFIPALSLADCLQGHNGQVYCGAGACQQSKSGQVFCSIYKDGGAKVNSKGRVECGVGQCLKGSTGHIFCSVTEDGGAALNSAGSVKCYGGCEPGSESMCEQTDGL